MAYLDPPSEIDVVLVVRRKDGTEVSAAHIPRAHVMVETEKLLVGPPSGPDPIHSDNPKRVDDVHAGVLSAAQGDRGPWEDDELTDTDNRSDPR
jgi:hypothetical protein